MRILSRNSIVAVRSAILPLLATAALSVPCFAGADEPPASATPPVSATPPASAPPPAAEAAAAAVAAAEPAPASAPPITRIAHVPPSSAPADQSLVISAQVEASHLVREIRLYVRTAGAARFERIPFRRESSDAVRFSAVIPAERMLPGEIEYYIASQGIGADARTPERLHFASPSAPHLVLVHGNDEARRRRALLEQHLGTRSRFQARVEYVNFGNRQGPSGAVSDSYVRGELDYTYRILGWVYSIRLGGGLLLGQTYISQNGQLLQIPDAARCESPGHTTVDCRVGLYYGFAELRFRFGRLVRFDVRPILGVGPQSFDGGGGGQLIIGHDPGTHVALGAEGVTHIGVRGWLRLAWDTVPRVPMAFTIDAENFPNNDSFAMRLMMDFSYRFARYFSVDVMGGYATRGWQIGGPTVGGALIAEF